MNKIVNGVWDGSELSNLEKLSIRSFQDNGHEFHLYVSQPTEGIPLNTIVHSTDEIVPHGAACWFSNPGHFSDYFRYNLIYRVGGWYVDVDTICLRPFDFEDPYVIIAEDKNGGPTSTIDLDYISSCVFKAPAGCELLKNIIEEIESRDPRKGCDLPYPLSDINIGNGPPMFRRWVPRLGLEKYIRPPYVFDALDWHDYAKFTMNGYQWRAHEGAHAIHLRRSFWSDANSALTPNKMYGAASLYEIFKDRHGIKNPGPFTCGACGQSSYSRAVASTHHTTFLVCEFCHEFCYQTCVNVPVAQNHECPLLRCGECGRICENPSAAQECQRICGRINRTKAFQAAREAAALRG